MPPRIAQLPPLVVNQIAAGEVIERPASVVKELLENSIDAGSGRIDIDVEQGGAELIRVVDDGCGIEPDDLPLAFASHATSKLRGADDLFRIGTLGFRGEALASIGGVARVTLQSRPPGSTCGAAITCDGGDLSPVRPWNGAAGTRIEVRQLFFNTPVRRKFLRAAATEIGHISEACTRLGLASVRTPERPGLHLVLRHNNKPVLEVPATTTLFDRVGTFFGPEVQGKLYAIEAEAGPARLSGFIADPACERGTARLQYTFVNGRWVRDRSLGHAVQEAYRGLLMTGRYAVVFLFLRLPPEQVDVNVHPTKAEVRFRNAQAVHHLVYSAVRQRLRAENLVPRLQVPADAPTAGIKPAAHPEAPTAGVKPAAHPTGHPTAHPAERPAPVLAFTAPPPPAPPLPALQAPKVIQLYDAYLVVETEAGMLVIDQHALHERILFEQLQRRLGAGQLEVQRLLIPEPVDLTAEQAARLLECREALAELGLGVEEFGGDTVLLTGYPALLGRRSPRDLLRAVVDHLMTRDRLPSREVLFNDLLSVLACHAAVRAGERLSPEMMAELVAQRELADDAHHCPHGRPTALLFSRHELERQFRRA
jgi:DNA mismatch repair protein MutL